VGSKARIQRFGYVVMICNVLGCNTESNVKLMYHHFHSDSKKPFCKEIMRVCENHAREITAEDTSIRIQALS
jgi:hypothetical protein